MMEISSFHLWKNNNGKIKEKNDQRNQELHQGKANCQD